MPVSKTNISIKRRIKSVQAGLAINDNHCHSLPRAQFCSAWSHILTVFFNAHYTQICLRILAEIRNQAQNDQNGPKRGPESPKTDRILAPKNPNFSIVWNATTLRFFCRMSKLKNLFSVIFGGAFDSWLDFFFILKKVKSIYFPIGKNKILWPRFRRRI